jgi:glycosyltransferase involved in cell wall biosynthesis
LKNLYLLTSNYPFGNSEPFLKDELPILSELFDQIIIIPNSNIGNINYPLPKNTRVITYPLEFSSGSILKRIWTSVLYSILEITQSRQKKQAFFHFLRNVVLFSDSYKKASFLNTIIDIKNNNYYYSFWFSHQATILSIMVENKFIKGYFSRAHKFDLYENIGHDNYIPFRKYQLNNLSKVFTVSQSGSDYLRKLYPKFSSKIDFSRLGVIEIGNNTNIEFNNQSYRILSISNIVPVKRVALILEILKHVKRKYEWVHFGDGYLMDELKEKVQSFNNPNVRILIEGSKQNFEVMNYLKNHHVSVLINTSISEGVPFSIMEAISFGIPVVATDVGGTSEIVDNSIGGLIEADFNPLEIAQLIDNSIDKWVKNEFREIVKHAWDEKYNANKNYLEFGKKIINHE